MIFVHSANQAIKNRFFKFWIKKNAFLDQKKEIFRKSNLWKSFKRG